MLIGEMALQTHQVEETVIAACLIATYTGLSLWYLRDQCYVNVVSQL